MLNIQILDYLQNHIHKLNNGLRVLRFDDQLIELDDNDYDIENALNWVANQENNIHEYYEENDSNKEFWDSVGGGYTLYHGTHEDRLDDIKKNGLEPRSETRGISNKSMSEGIFTSPTSEIAANYYDVVLEIDVGAMKRDGYMPETSGEDPLDDAILLEALAHELEIENADFRSEYAGDGLDPETLVFYGKIPPKYLSVV